MFYITGDKHGCFESIGIFCQTHQTTTDDVLIILGDAGINFTGKKRDKAIKEDLSTLPITLFCIHGNHEMRPHHISSYREVEWNDGIVWQEEEYPNLLFAKDGEIYNLDGRKTIVLGGAYSVDKFYRLANHLTWFEDEQPSEEIKKYAENQLIKADWDVDVVLSHTTPYSMTPTEMFIPGLDQSLVDNSTELWLDSVERRLHYQKWYAGHFHTDKRKDKLTLLFNTIEEFSI